MTELPLWAVYVVTFGTPLSALAGVLVGQWLARRTAKEADSRSRREELMRSLRWAAELAADADEKKAELGVAQLSALGESELLNPGDQLFVDAALRSVIRQPEDVIEEIEAVGAQVEVVEDSGGDAEIAQAPRAELGFLEESGEKGVTDGQ